MRTRLPLGLLAFLAGTILVACGGPREQDRVSQATTKPTALTRQTVMSSPAATATHTARPSPTFTHTPAASPTPWATRTFAPVPTETAIPMPTRTFTPTPTWTVSPSPTQTLTPKPTRTRTPKPTNTPTPTPQPYMPPVLLEPEPDYVCFKYPRPTGSTCSFRWSWSGTLKPNEYFQVQFIGSNNEYRGMHAPTKDMAWSYAYHHNRCTIHEWCACGRACYLRWTVAIVEWDGNNPGEIGRILIRAAPRFFYL